MDFSAKVIFGFTKTLQRNLEGAGSLKMEICNWLKPMQNKGWQKRVEI